MQLNRRGTFKARTRSRMEEEEYGALNSKSRRSGAYHRFFEGYSEEMVPKQNGKRNRILRVYVGEYYKRECSDREWFLAKAAYIFLYLAAASAYLFALTRPAESNTAWYTAAPGLLSVIPMVLLLVKVIDCAAAKRKMTAYNYRHVFQHVFLFCAIAAGFLCMTALMTLLFIVLNPQADLGKELTPCLFCLLGAGMILAIGIIERRAGYENIENPTVPSENSILIQ